MALPLSYARELGTAFPTLAPHQILLEMGGVGFEPTKAVPTDLQSVPFDRSGNPPLSLPDNQLQITWKTHKENTARASGGIRTHDLLITNQLLCQLSYAGRYFQNQ